jgi:hypothetical protein
MNAFKHGLAAIQKRRDEGIPTAHEESGRQQILDGLIADKGGDEQIYRVYKCEELRFRIDIEANILLPRRGKCGQGQNRTADTRIFSPLLYRLSYLARSLEYSSKAGGSQDWRLRFPILFCSLLDEVHHLALKMNAVQRVDFLNTRGAGDVDLSQIVADHVQTNKV